jgi:N-acetylneuraminic acid mutarotase
MRFIPAALALLAWTLATAAEKEAAYPPLPEGFSSFGAAVTGGYVYVYGGHTGKTHTYSKTAVTGKFRRLRLDQPSGGWQELPEGEPLQGLALVAHKGKLYRIGGMRPRNEPGEKADNVSVRSCAVFDPGANRWSPLPDLPEGRSSHDAAVAGDRIAVAGGWTMNGRGKASTWVATALVLDLARTPLKWEPIKQPFRRRALQAAALDGKVYFAGGLSADGGVERTVDVFDPATSSWSKAAELPGAGMNGFTPALCAVKGRLYASPADGRIYRLTARGDNWEAVGQLATRRMVHRAVEVSDKLLVLGGASRGGNVRVCELVALTGDTSRKPPAEAKSPVTPTRP